MSSGTLTGGSRAAGGRSRPARADEIRRAASLTYVLAITEWKLRFFGSVLGYLWTLVRPLLFFGVLYVVFTKVADFGNKIPHYPGVLLSGLVLYQFLAEATGNAVTCLVDRESLLRKVRFPRYVVPLSVCGTSALNLLTNLVAVIIFLLINGVTPTWRWLELPFLVAVVLALAVGLALLLSVLYVRYRDVRPIWEVIVQMLFYGSPIFYTIDLYGSFQELMARTPFAAVLVQLRHALIDPSAPTAAEAAGGTAYLLIPLAITLGILGLGVAAFRQASGGLAEHL